MRLCTPCLLTLSAALLLVGSAYRLLAAEALTPEEFQQLHAELQPGDAPWRTIPWNIDLLAAQRSAAQQGKPIFIWAMDGHPLGCT